MKRTRVALLTTVHPRRDVRIFEKEACSLAAAGFEVHLLVGDGRGNEVAAGVQIHDIGASPRGRLRRMLRQPWLMYRAARKLDARLYHFHDPELLWVGLALRLGGSAVIYDSHEDVPRDILSKAYIAPALRRLVAGVFEHVENFMARRMSAVVAATPHIAARFAAINDRSVAINNYPAAAELTTMPARSSVGRRVCYVGGIGRIRGLFEMLDALEQVDATLVMAGPFETAEQQAAAEAHPGWRKVDYRGTVSRAGVRDIMADSRAGLLFFHPEPNHVDAQPNKMFEYMSAGLPVLASDFPLWRQLLADAGAGRCADPLDAKAIARCIEELLADPVSAAAMGERGRIAVQQRYQWGHEEAKLVELYKAVLA